ncbi:MAG: ADP-glyceromanno-heptose 6-epimerase [Alphaproteobacteria bacterium]|jgi:ADP-L-glycero-D-manno-heptose 6-epimerase|nr:ADP-glyceromanno-heptose 6-epimerase [Alphaproteobacteria bacterium]
MYLVTGGAGFIGSNLVAALSASGHDIVVSDKLDESNQPNLEKLGQLENVPPEELLQWLDKASQKPEAIFHMGAISSTVERNVDLIMRNNYLLSLRLWEWATVHQIPFVYASSAATYGGGERGFDDSNDPDVLQRLKPLNPYGWSKLIFDRAAVQMAAAATAPPQWAGLRFFNVYGPNEYHKGGQRSVVPQFWQQIRENSKARLFKSHDADYPDGGQLRDFVHVSDTVSVMQWLLETPQVSGIFNLGTGQARSFDDLAAAIFTTLKIPRDVEYIPMPNNVRNQYQYFTEARIDRLRAAGYDKPFTSLEDGVRSYVGDYLESNDQYV